MARSEDTPVVGPGEHRTLVLVPVARHQRVGVQRHRHHPDLVVRLARVTGGVRHPDPPAPVEELGPLAHLGAAARRVDRDRVPGDGVRVGHRGDIDPVVLVPVDAAVGEVEPAPELEDARVDGEVVGVVGRGELGLEVVRAGGVVALRLQDVQPVVVVDAVVGRVVEVPAVAEAVELRGPDVAVAGRVGVGPHGDRVRGRQGAQGRGAPHPDAAALGGGEVVGALPVRHEGVGAAVERVAEGAGRQGVGAGLGRRRGGGSGEPGQQARDQPQEGGEERTEAGAGTVRGAGKHVGVLSRGLYIDVMTERQGRDGPGDCQQGQKWYSIYGQTS